MTDVCVELKGRRTAGYGSSCSSQHLGTHARAFTDQTQPSEGAKGREEEQHRHTGILPLRTYFETESFTKYSQVLVLEEKMISYFLLPNSREHRVKPELGSQQCKPNYCFGRPTGFVRAFHFSQPDEMNE